MTPPPTNIDGTDITGATIDGQDVQEITIDGQTVFAAVSTVLLDDFEDGDFIPANGNWSWIEFEGASVVNSPSLSGSFSGEASDSGGAAGWVGQRNTPAQFSAASTLMRVSNLTEQAGQYAIGKIITQPDRGAWPFFLDKYSFISRVSTLHDGSGRVDIQNGSTGLGSIDANENYRISWQNIDFTTQTYDMNITELSTQSVVASTTSEPFEDSPSDMDFFGWANGTIDSKGNTVSTYADDITVTQ